MNDAATTFRVLVVFCTLAFLGFAIAGIAIPSERSSLYASATAFLVGMALALAASRSHSELAQRLASIERQVSTQKSSDG